jgi:hypothetical protein
VKKVKSVVQHQTTRAAARLGLGAAFAAIVLNSFPPDPAMTEYWRVIIIVGVNEGAYGLKRLLARRET